MRHGTESFRIKLNPKVKNIEENDFFLGYHLIVVYKYKKIYKYNQNLLKFYNFKNYLNFI